MRPRIPSLKSRPSRDLPYGTLVAQYNSHEICTLPSEIEYRMTKENTRRSFLKKVGVGSAAIATTTLAFAKADKHSFTLQPTHFQGHDGSNDEIRFALIGTGMQGIYDTLEAVKVPGVRLVAACDLYTGRLDRARELWGKDLDTTRDYREILSRNDIDAVIVATPDHWHSKIAVDALQAGKAVYCEKPMIQEFGEGQAIIDAQHRSGLVCQVGSQGLSSLGAQKAKSLYQEGAIGEIVALEMYNDRYNAEGAWQYPIPPDAGPDTVDFDSFLGRAPKRPYDATRFFRWRNYRDYGTGAAGDLFVHAFSTLHFILDSQGPERAYASGGLRYWNDGREVPDVMFATYDYPKTQTHAAFNALLRVNFIAGGGGGSGFKLIGTDGCMEVSPNRVTLKRIPLKLYAGGYSLVSYTDDLKKQIIESNTRKFPENRNKLTDSGELEWKAPDDYMGDHYDHFVAFFEAIRGNRPVVEDPVFGYRAAAAALLANKSYDQGKPVLWDPHGMRLRS